MKEATGELNMAVFVIISIGILSAFFYTTIWPGMEKNMEKNVSCAKAICNPDSLQDGLVTCCVPKSVDGGITSCEYDDKDPILCPFKG